MSSILLLELCLHIIGIGHDPKQKIKGIRYILVRLVNRVLLRFFVISIGNVAWISQKQVDLCYKKYLGPDWKPDFDSASTVVANHQCFMDPFIHGLFRIPCIVMKERDKYNPLVRA